MVDWEVMPRRGESLLADSSGMESFTGLAAIPTFCYSLMLVKYFPWSVCVRKNIKACGQQNLGHKAGLSMRQLEASKLYFLFDISMVMSIYSTLWLWLDLIVISKFA